LTFHSDKKADASGTRRREGIHPALSIACTEQGRGVEGLFATSKKRIFYLIKYA